MELKRTRARKDAGTNTEAGAKNEGCNSLNASLFASEPRLVAVTVGPSMLFVLFERGYRGMKRATSGPDKEEEEERGIPSRCVLNVEDNDQSGDQFYFSPFADTKG